MKTGELKKELAYFVEDDLEVLVGASGRSYLVSSLSNMYGRVHINCSPTIMVRLTMGMSSTELVFWLVSLLVTGILAVARFAAPVHGINQADTFKDVAHLWVGIMIGVSVVRGRYWWWVLAVGLTVVEILAFQLRG